MAHLATFSNQGNIITAISNSVEEDEALFSMWKELLHRKADLDYRDRYIKELIEARKKNTLKDFSFYEDIRACHSPIRINGEIQAISLVEYTIFEKYSKPIGIFVC